jgi:transcription elongation GreA/GreB family factor
MSADPLAEIPAISVESPLGRALETHLEGDVVLVEAPEPYEIKVLKIKK